MNWPKDYIIVCKTRPGTHMARMDSRLTEWRQARAKHYSVEGAIRAFDTLRKAHSGQDWGIFHPKSSMLVRYAERQEAQGSNSNDT